MFNLTLFCDFRSHTTATVKDAAVVAIQVNNYVLFDEINAVFVNNQDN